MRRTLLFYSGLILLFISSCKKQTDPPPNPAATYTLVASGGACANISIQGSYAAGIPLTTSNTVSLQVNVSATGSYSLSLGTVNGYSFSGSGNFTSTGLQTIVLQGSGTPVNAGANLFGIVAGNSGCSFTITVTTASLPFADNDHMLMGNPSNAAATPDSANNYLMRKNYYAIAYSRDRGIANWVSWHLHAPDLGSTPRQDDFRPDNSLPAGWYQVPGNAYSGSGFDRGHSVPSADRTSSVEANSSTFLMTNMIPQAPNLNQQTWARLEDSLRRLVNAGFELYIIMGVYGSGGTGSNGFATSIHSGLVHVPAHIWKVAVVLPNGNNDTSRVDINTRVIAVSAPNNNTPNANWKNYRVSVDAIENATGFDLLGRLPASLQAVLEARVDNL